MPGFLVDAATLLDVRNALGRLHDELLAMPAVASGYEGSLGSPALEAQVTAFCGTCRDDTVGLGERMDRVMASLAAAAAAYDRADADADAAARRHRTSGWAVITVGPRGVKVVASGTGSPLLLGAQPDDVAALAAHFLSAADRCATTVVGLREAKHAGIWSGRAAEAFRATLSRLPRPLDRLRVASTTLRRRCAPTSPSSRTAGRRSRESSRSLATPSSDSRRSCWRRPRRRITRGGSASRRHARPSSN